MENRDSFKSMTIADWADNKKDSAGGKNGRTKGKRDLGKGEILYCLKAQINFFGIFDLALFIESARSLLSSRDVFQRLDICFSSLAVDDRNCGIKWEAWEYRGNNFRKKDAQSRGRKYLGESKKLSKTSSDIYGNATFGIFDKLADAMEWRIYDKKL